MSEFYQEGINLLLSRCSLRYLLISKSRFRKPDPLRASHVSFFERVLATIHLHSKTAFLKARRRRTIEYHEFSFSRQSSPSLDTMHYQKPGMTPTVVAGIRDSIELWRPIYDQKKDVKPEQKKGRKSKRNPFKAVRNWTRDRYYAALWRWMGNDWMD
jgi:hypothetical protein